ncbi:MAG: MbnP family protein [Cognaticolwellia sp.]
MTKPNKSTLIFSLLVIAIIAVVTMLWLRAAPQKLTLRFHPYVGDKPLVLSKQSYKNPGGAGEFSIRDLQLFISNIVINYPDSKLKEPESYHLIRFDADSNLDEVVIPDVTVQKLTKLSFAIGVDAKANSSIMFSGDLDLNSRMAWNWQVGYKFLLLEGSLTVKNQQQPLVYHIGFDESYTELSFDITNGKISDTGVINFKMDLHRLFQKTNLNSQQKIAQASNQQTSNNNYYIDMAEMSHVKFAPDDVAAIASNFNNFIHIF